MNTRVAVVWMMCAFGPLATSCTPDEPGPEQVAASPTPPTFQGDGAPVSPLPAPPVDPELPKRLRALHEAADQATSKEERLHAADELLMMFEDTRRGDSYHLVSVRQDLAARASHLLLDSSPERAKAAAESGLLLSLAPSVLRANLFIALADAEEALGDPVATKKALLHALAINEALFESEMESP